MKIFFYYFPKEENSLAQVPAFDPNGFSKYVIVTPQIRDVTGQRQTYTYASEAFTY